MIDLPVLVLFQQTDGFALHDRAGLQALSGNEVAIHVIPIRCPRPEDKAIRIGIRSSTPTRSLVLQGFFVIPMLLAGTRFHFDADLYHVDLSSTHLSRGCLHWGHPSPIAHRQYGKPMAMYALLVYSSFCHLAHTRLFVLIKAV